MHKICMGYRKCNIVQPGIFYQDTKCCRTIGTLQSVRGKAGFQEYPFT